MRNPFRSFVASMAVRESRAAWRRLLFFFFCIALGVGTIIALRSAITNLTDVIEQDARSIFTADVQVYSSRPWSKETLTIIDRVTAVSDVIDRTETVDAATMLRPAGNQEGGAIMIELKAVGAHYPFYGEVKLSGGQKFEHKLLHNHGALVAYSVLERLRLKVGDRVKIGESTFQIRGIIEREPGLGGGIRFGPRVFIRMEELEETGLTGFGSRARRRILLKVRDEKVDHVAEELRKNLKEQFARIRTYKQSEERLEEQFERAQNFLSLTGLIVLVLGGIGISSVTRVFIAQKKKTIAILKCLGASSKRVIAIYLAQVILLGAAGSLLGLLLAKLILQIVGSYYAASLPPQMGYALHPLAVAQGLGMGLLISLLFSALPLLKIRHVKPNVLLREEVEPTKLGIDRLWWFSAVMIAASLLLLTSWQAGSLQLGSIFLGGVLVTTGALFLAVKLLIRALRRIRRIPVFGLRYAVNGLYRPGNQTRVIVLVVGLGIFFVIAIRSLQSNLLHEFDLQNRPNMPNLYLIDIQKDQKEGIEKMLAGEIGEKAELIPIVRARIWAINGKRIDPESADRRGDRSRLTFEYSLTYRDKLQESEEVIAGRFWDPAPSSMAEVSIDESLKGLMDLDVGSTITMDIVGRKITAKVSSIRSIDWRNSRTGFYIIFRPGTLETAPQTFIAPIDAPPSEPQRSRFMRRLIDSFPNVTAIDVQELVEGIRSVIQTFSVAISFVGGFVLLSGILILTGSIAMTKFQRIYEAAILKTVGAKRKTVLLVFLTEYGLLGAVAGTIGAVAAIGLSYTMAKYVLDIPWHYEVATYVAGVFLSILCVVIVGGLSSIDILNRKPLAALKTE